MSAPPGQGASAPGTRLKSQPRQPCPPGGRTTPWPEPPCGADMFVRDLAESSLLDRKQIARTPLFRPPLRCGRGFGRGQICPRHRVVGGRSASRLGPHPPRPPPRPAPPRTTAAAAPSPARQWPERWSFGRLQPRSPLPRQRPPGTLCQRCGDPERSLAATARQGGCSSGTPVGSGQSG